MCKCLQSLQNNKKSFSCQSDLPFCVDEIQLKPYHGLPQTSHRITHVLGGNISLPNKLPFVLPFEGYSPMTKQVMNFFIYIKFYTLSIRGVTTVIIQRTLND